MMEKIRRTRSKRHLAYVGRMACLACFSRGVHVHHLLQGPEPKAKSVKAGDNWTVPLCPQCHDSLHRDGNEEAWAERNGLNMRLAAISLAVRSPDLRVREAAEEWIRNYRIGQAP